MSSTTDLPVKRFASRSAWEAWLAKHHDRSPGIWLELAKKDSGLKSVARPEALEVALCYGWIDGQTASVDAKRWRQRFTPRRPRSKWSKINCAAVEQLYKEGRLAPAGVRAMEAAKRDGRWEAAYPSPRAMTPPEDLEAALRDHPRARRAFEQLDSQNRYGILYRLHNAKKPETRERRLADFIRMLEAGELLHPKKAEPKKPQPKKPLPRLTRMTVSASFRTFILEQLGRGVPGIRGQSMFGGVGIYAGDCFFALIADDILYFKVNETTRPEFEARGMEPFRPYGETGEVMQYYRVPDDLLEDADALGQWAEKAVVVAQQAKHKRSRRGRSPGRAENPGVS